MDEEEASEKPEQPTEEAPTEEPTVEEQPSEAPTPTEESVAEEAKIPNIFMVGSFEGGRALVVLDEGKAYPMDGLADAFVREHNIPILTEYPEGVSVTGSDRAADLGALAKKLGA